MKKIKVSKSAMETARELCDDVETAMAVRSGVKAGDVDLAGKPGNGHGRRNNPNNEPQIIALYGVIVAE